MANQISGKVIAVSDVKTVPSADPSKPAMKKRELYMDCTRYDPYTGERSQYENKPLLEFAGDKVLDKVSPVLDTLQKDDIVTISFELVGRQYKGKDNKTKFSTGIRCYDIALTRKAGGQQQYFDNHQVAAPAPQPAPQPEPAPMAEAPFPQTGQEGGGDLPF